MYETIEQRTLRVISVSRSIPLQAVTPASTFEELGIDSLDRLNLLFDLECEFEVDIDDQQATQVKTVGEIIAGIRQLIEASPALAVTPIAS